MDTTLTIARITNELDKRFNGLIDLSNLHPSATETDRRNSFLSRGLAALAVMALSDAGPKDAADSVTDGYNDLGLDAIYFDSAEEVLYVVQSKWVAHANKTIDLRDCNNFLEGVRALIRADFSNANERLKARKEEIHRILMRPDVRITLVAVHTGTDPLGTHISTALGSFLSAQNNVGDTDVFTLEVFSLKEVYAHLDPDARKKISLTIGLSEWGIVREPYQAYYGQMKLSDVAEWANHGRALFDRNLRFYRGSTEVNNAMDETLGGAPDSFWYFNNGITVLCDAIDKAPLNGDDRVWGVFSCSGVSVVNGAQTVGVTWERARQNASFFSTLDAKVQVRIISLKNCPPGFGSDVTRATNTQNEIKHRDFAALDEMQQRIAHEMSLDGKRYAFKSGDADPTGEDGCTIEEATIAIACASSDVSMAVIAKRELGGLWKDITRHPYTTIFNERTNSRELWRAVIVSRAVNTALEEYDASLLERGDQIRVHGNRFLLHVVFQDSEVRRTYRNPSVTEPEIVSKTSQAAVRAFLKVTKAVNEKHAGAYLQPLFKNIEKCKTLFDDDSTPAERRDADLFSRLNEETTWSVHDEK